jgi:phosphate acetyltransferase
MGIVQSFKQKAVTLNKRIVLPEGTEPRTVKAAAQIAEEKIAQVILIGENAKIESVANEQNVKLDNIEIINPHESDKLDIYAEKFYELRKSKGVTFEQAQKVVQDEIYFATMMVKEGDADGLVAGAEHSTGDTIRPALQIIKTKPGISVVSGCFIMVVPDCEYGDDGLFVFADCAVNPNPSKDQLAEIALSTAETAKKLCGMDPKVSMLSFSTKGSARHELVDKVVEATKIAKEKNPELQVDGELQADAALVEKVASKKSPGSKVAGKANVLIFPDLQSGNIGYKLVERLSKGAHAYGPGLQGLNAPVNDLSRGCSVEDIVNVVAITAVQSS